MWSQMSSTISLLNSAVGAALGAACRINGWRDDVTVQHPDEKNNERLGLK